MLGSLASVYTGVIICFVSDSGAFQGCVCPTVSLPSQDFIIQRHQGLTIHNDGSSLVDLSLNSYTVLIIEVQDKSGP